MSTSNSTAILCLFIGLEEMLHRSGNRRWRLRKEGLEFEFRLALGSGDKQQHYYYYNTDSIRPPPLEDLSPMSLVFRRPDWERGCEIPANNKGAKKQACKL